MNWNGTFILASFQSFILFSLSFSSYLSFYPFLYLSIYYLSGFLGQEVLPADKIRTNSAIKVDFCERMDSWMKKKVQRIIDSWPRLSFVLGNVRCNKILSLLDNCIDKRKKRDFFFTLMHRLSKNNSPSAF